MVVSFRFVHKSQLRGNSSLKHLNSVIMKEQNYVRHVPTRLQQLNWKMWKGGILIQIFSSRSRGGSDNDTAHLTQHIWHCSLDTAHLTLYTWHCTLDTAHLTLHTWHCTLDTTHLTLHTWHYTLDTVHMTLHTRHCTLDTARKMEQGNLDTSQNLPGVWIRHSLPGRSG